MIDLGTLSGDESTAYGTNNDGHIVGRAQTADGAWHAFMWTPDTGMQRLRVAGAVSSEATAINNCGQVLGQSRDIEEHSSVFIWTVDSGVQPIPVPYPDPMAVDINDAGQALVAVHEGNDHDDPLHVLIWSESEGLRDLGAPYPGAHVSLHALAEAGEAIGWGVDPGPMEPGNGAFVVAQDGEARSLPNDTGSGLCDGSCSWAYGCNKHGQIVGATGVSDEDRHACIWTPVNVEAIKQEPPRLEVSFVVVDKRGNAVQHRTIPHEQVEFVHLPDCTACRFKGIDSKGRPKESVVGLGEIMRFDPHGRRTVTLHVMEDLRGRNVGTHLWTPPVKSHHTTDLGDLDGMETCGFGINNAGDVVGGAMTSRAERMRAFLWTEEAGMVDLGALGGRKACALEINDAGIVVGWAENALGRKRAFMWRRAAG